MIVKHVRICIAIGEEAKIDIVDQMGGIGQSIVELNKTLFTISIRFCFD